MKMIYEKVLARLKQIPELKWVDLDKGQLDFYETRPPVQFPCALVDIGLSNCEDVDHEQEIQDCDAIIGIRLAWDYTGNTSGITPDATRDESLSYFDLADKVYRYLQGFGDANLNKLSRQRLTPEKRDDGYKVINIPFSTSFEDKGVQDGGALPPLCAPATAVVKDQNGAQLASEEIASGATKNIIINTGAAPLYTYPYASFNTGQTASYAQGDDKWVWDNVIKPEINSWPTDRPWVMPVLDPSDPTKLLSQNYFGNYERFTDEIGGQDYVNSLKFDHLLGVQFNIVPENDTMTNLLALRPNYNGKNDWFMWNQKLIDFTTRGPLYTLSDYNYIYGNILINFFANGNTLRGVDQTAIYLSSSYPFRITDFTQNRNTLFFRLAFKYDASTQKMILA